MLSTKLLMIHATALIAVKHPNKKYRAMAQNAMLNIKYKDAPINMNEVDGSSVFTMYGDCLREQFKQQEGTP